MAVIYTVPPKAALHSCLKVVRTCLREARKPRVVAFLGSQPSALSSSSDHQTEPARQCQSLPESTVQERVRLLSTRLDCRDAEIRMAVHKYPRLLAVRERKLLKILDILNAERITKDEILTYPDVFTHSLKSLTARIKELKGLQVGKIKLASLRESNRIYGQKVNRIQSEKLSETPFESKEELLVYKLGCTLYEAEVLVKDHNLETTRLSTLKSKLDLLESYSVPKKMILDKLWMLRFPQDVLDCRLKLLRESGIDAERCSAFVHLLSCEERLFATRFRSHCEQSAILADCRDKSEYLQRRLKCDSETLSEMVRKNHKLLSINVRKLQAHLDFCLEDGRLNAADLIEYPRIFNFSVDKVKSRFLELKELGLEFGAKELSFRSKFYERYLHYWRKKSS